MEIENPVDFNGTDVISKYDILSDDLICHIKSLNPTLGTPDDPYYAKYEQYRDELDAAELIIVDANALNRSSLSDMDLSGDSGVDDLPSNFFQCVLETLATAFGSEQSSIDYKPNEYEGFEAFAAFGETEFSALSGGHY